MIEDLFLFILIVYLIYDMSILKDFNEYPIYIKSSIITLLFVIPFWFGIIYYFNRGIIELDWRFSLIFALIPSLLWNFLFILGSYLLIHFSGQDFSSVKNNAEFWVMVAIDTVIYLVVLSLILMLTNMPFKMFLINIFGFKLLALIGIKPYGKLIKYITKKNS